MKQHISSNPKETLNEQIFYQLNDPILTQIKQNNLNNRQHYLQNLEKSTLTHQQLEHYTEGIQNILYDCALFTSKKSENVLLGQIRRAVQVEENWEMRRKQELEEENEVEQEGNKKGVGSLRVDHRIVGAMKDFAKLYLLELIQQIYQNNSHMSPSSKPQHPLSKWDIRKAQYCLHLKKTS